jgi:glucosamine--fructose-6-phosphate aminotransferase (isomerizing)
MCGITGYIGKRQAVRLSVEQLQRLEYRGYDSAGVACCTNGHVEVLKAKGKIAGLQSLLDEAGEPRFGREADSGGGRAPWTEANVAVAHTRWATHGRPSTPNAHPHTDCSGKIAVVHNGIIENYLELREQLIAAGHEFRSETDTEVLPHLIEAHYQGDLEQAIRAALAQVRGSYAIAVVSSYDKNTLYAARKDSPLVIGLGDGENFVASDIPAVLGQTRDVIVLEDGDFAVIRREGVTITSLNGAPVHRPPLKVTWDAEAAEKGGYEHFMRKEIHEQPATIRDTMRGRVTPEDTVDLAELGLSAEKIRQFEWIYLVACGTAYHAGLVAKQFFEKRLRIPVEADLASEFRYRDPVITDKTLVIVISQSGETADTIAAMRAAADKGATTLGIVNVIGSTISREAQHVLHTQAGPEICVASTKAYVSQLIGVYLLGLYLARQRGVLSASEEKEIVAAMRALPDQVQEVLEGEKTIIRTAEQFAGCTDFFFLGRGLDYAVAMEGALKLKEISYIHSEALAAGEMKHGTLALIVAGVSTICIATQRALYQKMISNVKEVKAREATVLGIVRASDTQSRHSMDELIYVPETLDELMPVATIVPMQLLSYHIARLNGCEIDQPRNLAKSVTVE